MKQDIFHSLNKIGHGLHDLDPVFGGFFRSPQMKQFAAHLGLSDSMIINAYSFSNMARIGGVVDIHQDSAFLYTEPNSCIGFWFALEDATIENGCIWAMPGRHLTPLPAFMVQKKSGRWNRNGHADETPYSMEGMIPLEVKKDACIAWFIAALQFTPNKAGICYTYHQ